MTLDDISTFAIIGIGPLHQDEVLINWNDYDKRRQVINENFHVEFEDGDRPGSLVRVLTK